MEKTQGNQWCRLAWWETRRLTMPRRRLVEHLPVDAGAEEVAIDVAWEPSDSVGDDVGWATFVDEAEGVTDAWVEDTWVEDACPAEEEGSGSSEPELEPEPLLEPENATAGPGIVNFLKLLSQMSGHLTLL